MLLAAVDEVIMLHRSSLPVFDNVATMNAELGYLMFLVRSTAVWGVSSVVSGGFDRGASAIVGSDTSYRNNYS